MPISKRAPRVALTQTAKKTRDHKTNYIQSVRDVIDGNERIYLFSYENMRSNHFKDVRLEFRGGAKSSSEGEMEDDETDAKGGEGRIFLGKNKLLQIAMGRGAADEYADNLHRVSKLITGSVGLLCTNRAAKDVEKYFAGVAIDDFARAGSVAPRRVVLSNEQIETHPVNQTEQFRKLGMPVEVNNGRVSLVAGVEEYVVCKEGSELSAEACKILFHMGVKLATFKIKTVCRWEKETGSIENFE